jgi:hypothetical protein
MVIDQHAVVTLTMHCTIVTMLDVISNRRESNPISIAPYAPIGTVSLTVNPTFPVPSQN